MAFDYPTYASNVNRVVRARGPLISEPVSDAPPWSRSYRPPPLAFGVPLSYAAEPIQGETPAPMIEPPPSAPAPGSPEFIGPIYQQDIGMGVPVAPSEAVTSVDIPAQVDTSGIATALKALGGRGGGGGGGMPIPRAVAPQMRVGSRPEFIYTNPAAAQQAAANFAARTGAATAQDRDYLARLNESQNQSERARAQADLQAQQLAAAQAEGAANRASSERIAGTGEAVRQYRQAHAEWQANQNAHLLGRGDADTVNKDPTMLRRVGTRNIRLDPRTNQWVPKFPDLPEPTPPPSMGVPGSAPVPPPPSVAVPQAAPAPAPAPTNAPPAAVPAQPSTLSRLWSWGTLPGLLYQGTQAALP